MLATRISHVTSTCMVSCVTARVTLFDTAFRTGWCHLICITNDDTQAGLDSGDVFPEPNMSGGKPTYRGRVLQRAAAISAAAHVGQVSRLQVEGKEWGYGFPCLLPGQKCCLVMLLNVEYISSGGQMCSMLLPYNTAL